eukprot:CAMPEP_0171177372 /NCGR_PEP_ID=MMETSP0790-20130122/12206_1 /TAXON_ID=2925 /ORGANISM="Alexandrium catenella, Strain OF101" /LENGTH=471 /DNA_ID=CAMNT_0011642269 /DNA_START=1 /DNA_END=1412 /DNA_ORIENTATION=-
MGGPLPAGPLVQKLNGFSLHWPELDEGDGAPGGETAAAGASTSSGGAPEGPRGEAAGQGFGGPLGAGAAASDPSSRLALLPVASAEDAWSTSIDGLIDDAARQYLQSGAQGDLSGPFGSGYAENDFGPGGALAAGSEQLADQGLLAAGAWRDAKTALNELCQKACRRPISKQDVVYTVYPHGRGYWQANLSVHCLGGQEFRGEVCRDRRDAEKSAAEQALQFYATDDTTRGIALSCSGAPVATLPAPGAAPSKALLAGRPLPAGSMPIDETLPQELQGQNYKLALNTVLGKLMKKSLQRDSTVYQAWTVPGGFQVALQLPCLPGAWGQQAFIGQVCSKRKDAEASAAGAALGGVMGDQEMNTWYRSARLQPPSKWLPGKGGIRAQQDKLTSAAARVYLAIYLDKRSITSVEVGPATSMASVRVLIKERRISSLPANFLFADGGIPLPREQENLQLARDYLPQVSVVPEDLR